MKNQTEIACKMIQKKSTLNILNEKTKARNILHLFFYILRRKYYNNTKIQLKATIRLTFT